MMCYLSVAEPDVCPYHIWAYDPCFRPSLVSWLSFVRSYRVCRGSAISIHVYAVRAIQWIRPWNFLRWSF